MLTKALPGFLRRNIYHEGHEDHEERQFNHEENQISEKSESFVYFVLFVVNQNVRHNKTILVSLITRNPEVPKSKIRLPLRWIIDFLVR